MTQRFRASLLRYSASESGTIAVTRLFMVAAALSVGLIVFAIFMFGPDTTPRDVPDPVAVAEAEFRAAHNGRDRATVLAEGPKAFFSSNEIRARYLIFADPRQTSDAELRSAHRTWARRAIDPPYSQPGRAADMVLLLEQALAARGLQPHRDI